MMTMKTPLTIWIMIMMTSQFLGEVINCGHLGCVFVFSYVDNGSLPCSPFSTL
jgi:hypothetical protein